jgi:hypothetical protein
MHNANQLIHRTTTMNTRLRHRHRDASAYMPPYDGLAGYKKVSSLLRDFHGNPGWVYDASV